MNRIRLTFQILVALGSLIFVRCSDDISSPSSYTPQTTNGTDPCWFPDGKSILYLGRNPDPEFGFYAIDVDGTNKRPIMVPKYASSFDLSPDGSWVAYSYSGNIYKRRITGDTQEVQLTFQDGNFFPSWSSDGEWIAFDSNFESPNGMHFVWKMRSDGTEKKRIIHSPESGEIRQPDWFPDGIRLAVARNFVGHGGAREIAIIDTIGNSLAVLTNDEIPDRSPRVSNDGLFIVFEKDVNFGQVFRIKSDGTDLMKLSEENSMMPNWSPDGNWVTYSSYNPLFVYVMDKNGLSKRKL